MRDSCRVPQHVSDLSRVKKQMVFIVERVIDTPINNSLLAPFELIHPKHTNPLTKCQRS